MRYYRSIFSILFLLFLPFITAAAPISTWGGFINSSSVIEVSDEAEFQQEIDAGLWIKARLSENAALEADATYQFDLDRYYYANLSRFVFTGEHPRQTSFFNYRIGRFAFSDFSNYVLAHKLDGAELTFGFPWGTLTTEAGYSGLNFVPSSNILITQSDVGVHASAPSHGYELAPPKLIEQIELSFPQLWLQQDITFSLIAQQDMQPESNLLTEDDRISTEYLGIEASGSFKEDLYHRLFGFLNYGHGAYNTVAYLLGGELSYYMQERNFSRLKIHLLFSSGDADQGTYYGGYSGADSSNHFIPISSRDQFGVVFSPNPGNITVGSASYSIKPISRSARGSGELQIELTALTFFRNSTGAISESGVSVASDDYYLGSEADVRLNYRPFSDLGIELSSGLFMPNNYSENSPFANSRAVVEPLGRLNVSFTF
ncbi:MAG: hypothetical protein ACOC7X_11065 [Spirochaetota bacterium]